MNLKRMCQSQSPDRFHPSLDELVEALNAFASLQGYDIVKRRTKVSKKGGSSFFGALADKTVGYKEMFLG